MKKRPLLLASLLLLSACGHNEQNYNEHAISSVATEKTTIQTTAEITTTTTESLTETTGILPETDYFAPGQTHGSASYIDGTTIIVSFLGYDPTNEWDYNNEEDSETIHQTLSYLETATDWITEEVKSYGAEARFVYNWEENPDLIYGARFYEEMESETTQTYFSQRAFIDTNIDSGALLEKYNADNIIYMFFFNTDFSNSANPFTMPNPYHNGILYDKEIINIFVKFDDVYVTPPATYAHEILHTFGAHDLYYENDAITAEYVEYCSETGSRDIMFTVDSGDTITNILSETDAYYIGIADNSDDVEKWGLAESEYKNNP